MKQPFLIQVLLSTSPSTFRLRIGLALLVYGLLRCYQFQQVPDTFFYDLDHDHIHYLDIAASLAVNGNYAKAVYPGRLAPYLERLNQEPLTLDAEGHGGWRTPVWPSVLALLLKLCHLSITYTFVAKLLINALSLLLLAKLMQKLRFSPSIQLLGLILLAAHPSWMLYSMGFLSEPFAMLGTLLLVTSLFVAFKKSTLWQGVYLGSSALLLVLTHPVNLFFPFILLLFSYVAQKLPLRVVSVAFGILLLGLGTWTLRNARVYQSPQLFLTTGNGADFARGWSHLVPSSFTNIEGDLLPSEVAIPDALRPLEQFDLITQIALYRIYTYEFLASHPSQILPISLRKLSSAFNPLPEKAVAGILEYTRVAWHLAVFLGMLYFLLYCRNHPFYLPYLSLLLSVALMSIAVYSGFRFRMSHIALEILMLMAVCEEISKRIAKHNAVDPQVS